MLDYQSTTGCRMSFLREQLDDPELGPQPCGRCDNCAGSAYHADVDARAAEGTRGAADAPRRRNHPAQARPTGLGKLGIAQSGKITDGPAAGRVLG